MIIQLANYTLDVDVEATKKAYKKLPLVTESCVCQGCENYMAAIDKAPHEVKAFFSSLGVDLKRPSELWDNFYENGYYNYGGFYYGGFYHVVGTIVFHKGELYLPIKKKQYRLNPQRIIDLSPDFSVWLEEDCSLVPDGFPSPQFQINISANLPWSLTKSHMDEVPASKIKNIRRHCL